MRIAGIDETQRRRRELPEGTTRFGPDLIMVGALVVATSDLALLCVVLAPPQNQTLPFWSVNCAG